MASSLKPCGLFALSVGHTDAADVGIHSSGRFAYIAAYFAGLAEMHGFAVLASEPATLRTENGRPIEGRLVALKRRKKLIHGSIFLVCSFRI